jgi:hypothetical protein
MFLTYILPLAIGAMILVLSFWVTKKAYSKKWDENE